LDLQEIVKAIDEGRINITEHADEELAADSIYNEELYHSVREGEIIEDYPDDFPFPSCLIYGKAPDGKPIHSVWAYAGAYRKAILITAYVPDPTRWIDFRERRK
jgi:hypothetical protein